MRKILDKSGFMIHTNISNTVKFTIFVPTLKNTASHSENSPTSYKIVKLVTKVVKAFCSNMLHYPYIKSRNLTYSGLPVDRGYLYCFLSVCPSVKSFLDDHT